MSKNYYIPGENNVICDSCGKKIKVHEARVRWDGLVVCQADYEERQPQDFVRARQDKITVPLVRPRPTDIFVSGNFCTTYTRSGAADIGSADCSLADFQGDFVCRTYYSPNDVEDGTSIIGIAVVGYCIVGESTYTTTICAPSYYQLDDIAKSVSGVAISGYSVSGTPISMSPTI